MHVTRTDHENIIIERRGSAAIIRLNRPQALNSVTLPMVRIMKDALAAFADDASVSCVVLAGEGERGLCAGGDIRALYTLGKAGDPSVTQFWREEFPLNQVIANYPRPYVALMDGITMGGGVGLASHGRYRIVTERTRLAMPETGIGYFPDVGATWLLPRAPGETGTWLGLTGSEIGAQDAIHAGLADCHVRSSRLGELVDALAALEPGCRSDAVGACLAQFSEDAQPGILVENAAIIDRTFAFDRVEDIVEALEREEGDFAARTLEALGRRSPTSLKLTLRLLRAGRDSDSLEDCLEREFSAGIAVLRGHDFYEGVRAAVIDKDRSPSWSPPTIAGVADADIDACFPDEPEPLFT